jgi:hypothetical protein
MRFINNFGSSLIADAPRGALTEDIVQGIRQHKPELLQLLSLGPQPPGDTNTETVTDIDGAKEQVQYGQPRTYGNAKGTPSLQTSRGECTPPWRVVNSPCPDCHKPQRLFVRGSPDIEGESNQDVLICSKCGYIEPACLECQRSNLVTDALGIYCVDCRKRPGQPKTAPEPVPRGDPLPLTSHRHRLGEQPPPFDCRTCGPCDWREAIYHWACRGCQQIEMKPEDSVWPDAQDRPPV